MKLLLRLLGLVGVMIEVAVCTMMTSEQVPTTAQEAELVVTIQDLSSFLEGFEPDPSKVSFVR